MTTATDNTAHTLLALRRRESVRSDPGAVALIDAAIEGDADAMLRARVGDVVLTARQLELLRFIDDFSREAGYMPTHEEIGGALGITKTTVNEHIHSLLSKGVLAMDKHKARSMRIVERK